MFVTTLRVNAQSNLPRKNSSGSGSAKLSKLFNLQLFLKRVERAFSFVWSFRGSGGVGSLRPCLSRVRAGRGGGKPWLGCCLACPFQPGRSVSRHGSRQNIFSSRRCDAGGARHACRPPTTQRYHDRSVLLSQLINQANRTK